MGWSSVCSPSPLSPEHAWGGNLLSIIILRSLLVVIVKGLFTLPRAKSRDQSLVLQLVRGVGLAAGGQQAHRHRPEHAPRDEGEDNP